MGYLEYLDSLEKEKEEERMRIRESEQRDMDEWLKRVRRKNWIEMGCLVLFWLVATIMSIIHFLF